MILKPAPQTKSPDAKVGRRKAIGALKTALDLARPFPLGVLASQVCPYCYNSGYSSPAHGVAIVELVSGDGVLRSMSVMAIYRQPSRAHCQVRLTAAGLRGTLYAYEIATLCPHSACLFVQRFRRCSSIAERIEKRADIRCAAT